MLCARRLGALVVSSMVAASLAGCTASSESTGFQGTGAAAPTSGAGQGQGGATGSSSTEVSVGSSSNGNGGGPPEIAEVFGHSPDVLYKLEPTTKAVTVVGPFQGCSSVIDIALDKDSNLYGTTFGDLFRIDKTTAACTLIASGSYPNSLSFVPAGTLDPNVEALVGYVGSTYVRIDTTTGAMTDVGGISGGYVSSGDIVSVKDGMTLLTVNGAGCGDCIVEVNPATGDLVTNYGPLPYGAVFGLAFWAGTAYGFSDGGNLFEVTFPAGGSVTTAPIPIPNPPPGLQFWGAGSTTSAPPTDVPN